jgi:hypothetical protein
VNIAVETGRRVQGVTEVSRDINITDITNITIGITDIGTDIADIGTDITDINIDIADIADRIL